MPSALPYLADLTIRLSSGVGRLPLEMRQTCADSVWSAQREDGGFRGRDSASDLYYTGFALRTLAILGQLEGERAESAGRFLTSHLTRSAAVIDFISLIYGAILLEAAAGVDIFAEAQPLWRQNVAQSLETLRRDDGGYAKAAEGHASSTYHTFLVLLALQ